jgi:circadian clock protein KaiB
MTEYKLKLYVTGDDPTSSAAIANIREICKEEINEYSMEVIDINEHPQLAEEEKIWATPTLVKELPEPLKRVVGDLSRKSDVLLGLDITSDIRPDDA